MPYLTPNEFAIQSRARINRLQTGGDTALPSPPEVEASLSTVRSNFAMWKFAQVMTQVGMMATSPSEMRELWTESEIAHLPCYD